MGQTNRKNVIVVGAGASKEFGLPTGAELKGKIANLLNIKYNTYGDGLIAGDQIIANAFISLSKSNGDMHLYQEEAWRISQNMPIAPSIDNFLDTHSNNEKLVEVGKLAITKAILNAEKNSCLTIQSNSQNDSYINLGKISETWLGRFFKVLVAQRNFSAFKKALKSIIFISFNYDRCIHQFISYASKSYFVLDDAGVAEVVDSLNVIYPYGNVGDYEFRANGFSNFGENLGVEGLIRHSGLIKTFTQGAEENIHDEIHSAFYHADLVMFMGFGFLDLNMNLLHQGDKFFVQSVIGTAYRQSANSISDIKNEILTHFKNKNGGFLHEKKLHVLDCTCSDLIFEFNRLLST